MEEAMSFTYQKSYRGIHGEKTATSAFLSTMSTPKFTWLIPFPKFIMNSVEFMYTHAPIIGLTDVPVRALFGQPKRGKGFFVKQRMAKQVTGMGMLYGAIQLRAQQGPDAKWWEWYDEDTGKYENALAFYGPFAAYMLAADLILRSNLRNKKVSELTGLPLGNVPLVIGEQTTKNWQRIADDSITETLFSNESDTWAQFLKAVFGSTFRTGTGLEIVDTLYTDLKVAGDDGNFKDFQRAIATFGGNYVNTFGVGFGEIRDIYGIVDDQYKVIRDPEALVNPIDLFIAKATRSMPISEEGKLFGLIKGPKGIETPARSATIKGRLYREQSGRKQLTGRGTTRAKDIVQRALDTHRIPRYKAFPKLKHPELDKIAKDIYNEYTEKRLFPILSSSSYTDVPETPEGGREQKRRLNSILDLTKTQVYDTVIQTVGSNLRSLERSKSKDTGKIEKHKEQLIYMFKLQFSKLSTSTRSSARVDFGKTPKSWTDWQALYNRAKQIQSGSK